MKTITTLLFISLLSLLTFNNINAQCVSPGLKFVNPTLVSGTALSEGAIYKFPEVITGVDCYIKLKKLNGGAVLISMETPGQGYADAWQPIISGPGAPANNKSWIDWEISFKTTAGTDYSFPCLDISAIDVDGDNSVIGEFIESAGHASYGIPSPTFLTLTNPAVGALEAQAPIINRPSIDTSALDVRITFSYTGKDKIELKLGSKVYAAGASAPDRLNCIYFKKMTFNNYIVLPVKYVSLNALASDNKVNLNWSTDNEVNNNYFEVERSFDGRNFTSIAMVMDALTVSGNNRYYGMRDNANLLTGKSIVYYRLKQVDIKGAFNYTSTIVVKLQPSKSNSMQVAPNPFNENLSLSFSAPASSIAVIRLQTVTGQSVIKRNIPVSNGSNTVQLGSLGELPRGIYAAQVVINGIIVHNQKVIKG